MEYPGLMSQPKNPNSPRGYNLGCELRLERVISEGWFWHCVSCDMQGEPTDIISAVWGASVHEKEREENE